MNEGRWEEAMRSPTEEEHRLESPAVAAVRSSCAAEGCTWYNAAMAWLAIREVSSTMLGRASSNPSYGF